MRVVRGPATALLWESWRLSRPGILAAVVIPTALGAIIIAKMTVLDGYLALMLTIIVSLTTSRWATKVERRGGFGMELGFARPVRTWVLVLVPMLYIALSTAMVYLIPVVILRSLFGIAFPLLPLALLLATWQVVFLAVAWSSRSRLMRGVLTFLFIAIGLTWIYPRDPGEGEEFFLNPGRWADVFAFGPAEYSLMGILMAASAAIALGTVGRQRRGEDGILPAPGANRDGTRGPAELLRRVLLVRWPVSSPALGQLRFELSTVALPVLRAGVLMAAAIWALNRLGSGLPIGQLMLVNLTVWSPFIVIWMGKRRALGLQRRQGRSYLSSFDAIRPVTTGRLVYLKLAVATLSVLIAWILLGLSAWGWLPTEAGMEIIEDTAPGLIGISLPKAVGTAVLFGVHLFGAIALLAGFQASLVTHARTVVMIAAAFLGYLMALAYGTFRNWLEAPIFEAPVQFTMAAALILLGAACLLYRAYDERMLDRATARGVVAIWVLFASLQLALHPRLDFLNPGDDPLSLAVALVSIVLPLAGAALAPWSYGRLRHR